MPFLIDSIGMELNRARLRRAPDHPSGHPGPARRRGQPARGAPPRRGGRRHAGRVRDPRGGRPPDRPGRARAARGSPRARDRRGARRGDRLARDARAGARPWSPSWAPTRRRSTPTRSPRRARSWSGSRTTTSSSSATASTSCPARPPSCRSCRCRTRALGILRQAGGEETSRGFENLPPAVRARALEPYLLNLTKANSRATVHRPSFLDYVGIKRFDENGGVIGERRFLGLYTHNAYQASPREIPILRRKVDAVLRRAAFPADSHDEKALARDPRELPARRAVPDLRRRPVPDRHGDPAPGRAPAAAAVRAARHLRPLRLLPRVRAARPLQHREPAPHRGDPAAGPPAPPASTTRRACPSRCWCACTTSPTSSPARCPDLDERQTETLLVAATRSWGDDLEEALIEEYGEERGAALYRRYGEAFPRRLPGRLGAALGAGGHRAHRGARRARRPVAAPLPPARGAPAARCAPRCSAPGRRWRCPTCCRCSRTWAWRSPTSGPTRSSPRDRESVWIYDFGLTYSGADELETERVRDAFQDAFIRAWRGDTESDGYNRLVLRAGLTSREATVLRAIGRYLRQAGTTFSDRYVEQALVAHPRGGAAAGGPGARPLRPARRPTPSGPSA